MSFADISFPILPPEQQLQALRLQRDIAVLREARDCVTDTCTPAVIYGRVDDLINQRQNALLGLFRINHEAEGREVMDRG